MTKVERIQKVNEMMKDAPQNRKNLGAKAFFDKRQTPGALKMFKQVVGASIALRERTEARHDDGEHSAEYAPLNCRKCAAKGWKMDPISRR